MTELQTIGYSKVYTHKKVLRQDLVNSHVDFTASQVYQDFLVLGVPANHMILGVKMAVLINFNPGNFNSAIIYVGPSAIFPANPTSTFVTDETQCYGVINPVVGNGAGDSYEYGSFRWFTLSSPGSNSSISPAYCLPLRTDAHDVLARIVVSGGHNVSQITAGTIEITTQYGTF